MSSEQIVLQSGQLRATLLPAEGAVCAELLFSNLSLLAKTPWAQSVTPAGIAADEKKWVESWRGGWQLCAPNVAAADSTPEGPAFHGAASQAPWEIISRTESSVVAHWQSQSGIEISRRFQVDSGHLDVSSELTNHGKRQPIGIAEHLILGSDFLKSVLGNQPILLEYQAANIIELDYTAKPTGREFVKADTATDYTVLTSRQEARVFSASQFSKRLLVAIAGDLEITISWEGLDYLLIWQEFQHSAEAPWNNQVLALGIEPTNIPHGAGSVTDSDPKINQGEKLTWRVRLSVSHSRKGDHLA